MNSDKVLHKLSNKELGKLFPIIIQKPDKNWKKIFETEKQIILGQFEEREIESIEHIGSTAIPDLKSKPTIDILMEISRDFGKEKILKNFKTIGYEYIQQPDNPPPHMMSVKGYSTSGFKGQAFHVHIRYKGDWDELYFRDYFRKNEEVKREYEKLKLDLAIKYKNDRDAYTNAKTDFIENINKLARQEKTKTRPHNMYIANKADSGLLKGSSSMEFRRSFCFGYNKNVSAVPKQKLQLCANLKGSFSEMPYLSYTHRVRNFPHHCNQRLIAISNVKYGAIN